MAPQRTRRCQAVVLEVFAGAGHMPHDVDPERFAAILTDFCEGTDAARLTADHWQPMLSDEPHAA